MAPKRKKNDELITLTDDAGKSYLFELIEVFAVGKKTFAVVKEEGDKQGDLAILKVKVGKEGQPSEFMPPTEKEWNQAIDALGCFDEGEDDGEACCADDDCSEGADGCCCGCAEEEEAPVKKAAKSKSSKAKSSSKPNGGKEFEDEIITVTADDGEVRQCQLLEVFPVGKKSFAIVHELDAPENEAILLKVKPGARGKPATYVEPTDEEWNQATDALGCSDSCDCGDDCECDSDCGCGDDCCGAEDELIEQPARKAAPKAKSAAKSKPAAKVAGKVAPKAASKAKPAAKASKVVAPKAKPAPKAKATKVSAKAAPKPKAGNPAAKAVKAAKPAPKAKASRRTA